LILPANMPTIAPGDEINRMPIDPERNITITLPFGMVERLMRVKPILSMFGDDEDVRAVIDIIEAIHAGALEYVREEEGELMDYLTSLDDEDIDLPDDGDDEDDNGDNHRSN
jgi:hypothetical protein